jgi:hypothetical protein
LGEGREVFLLRRSGKVTTTENESDDEDQDEDAQDCDRGEENCLAG